MSHPDFTRARWIKSRHSEPNGDSVELATADGIIANRDSKLGSASPILTFTPAEFTAWLDAAKAGEFDHLA